MREGRAFAVSFAALTYPYADEFLAFEADRALGRWVAESTGGAVDPAPRTSGTLEARSARCATSGGRACSSSRWRSLSSTSSSGACASSARGRSPGPAP